MGIGRIAGLVGAAALGAGLSLGALALAHDGGARMTGGHGMGMMPGSGQGIDMMHGGGHGIGMMHGEGHGMNGIWGMPRAALARGLDMLTERFDADGDGAVTQEEIDAGRAAQLSRFDADGDGTLSLEEYEALWLAEMRPRMVDRFQAHDDDGDGQVTTAEFGARLDGLVARRDRNGDGMLSVDDLRPGGAMPGPQRGAN